MSGNAKHHTIDRDAEAVEYVDLDDLGALRRAVDLHQAGKAVFAVPFGTTGPGRLTWLDPRQRG
jgi:hypothetical protein